MPGRALECELCQRALPSSAARNAERATCACGTRYAFVVLPAAFSRPRVGQPAPARSPEQASCFFHREKLASAGCDSCGRLLCSVCDVLLEGRHWCASCLAAGHQLSISVPLARELWMHDSITLLLAALPPLAFWPATPFTASYALYRGVKYFGQPRGLVPRTRVRLVLAMLLASLQLAALAGLVALLLVRRRH